MKKLVLLAVFLALAGNVLAQGLCENFPDPLGGWRDRWLARYSNMTNYYVCTGDPDENNRGNNPCGLWICDTDQDFQTANITLDPTFGAGVNHWVMGIMVFVPAIYTVYDINGGVTYTQNLPADGTFPPCDNSQIACDTPRGMSRFLIAPNGGGGIEGNTSVFNICASAIGPVPVRETTWGRIKARFQ